MRSDGSAAGVEVPANAAAEGAADGAAEGAADGTARGERASAKRPPPDPATIAALQAGIRRLGGSGPTAAEDEGPDDGAGVLPLGVAAIDAALPWRGLPRAALHEIVAADDPGGGDGAAIGFAAMLAARLARPPGTVQPPGTVLWCRRTAGPAGRLHGHLYGPGLAGLGLDPKHLVVVRARREVDLLWALEEALRSGAPAAVVGETDSDRMTALRRLQLAAETHRVPALLVRSGARPGGPGSGTTPAAMAVATPAVTRWRIGAATSGGHGGPRPVWRLTLERCRGRPTTSGPKTWIVEWRDATCDLAVAADVRHRSPPAAADGPAAS